MIDATTYPDVEAAVIDALQLVLTGVMVSNETPRDIPAKLVTVGYSGGGSRDLFEASVNVGINVYAATDADCRTLVRSVQDWLAATSNDLIETVRVPAGGGASVPRQSPPFQRYFVATVLLRAQSLVS
jgi:hypothetical protein